MEIMLQGITLALVVIGGTGLWFGFGVKLGNIQKEVAGIKELHQSKLDNVKKDVGEIKENLKACQGHERDAEKEYDARLRSIETKTAVLEGKE